MERRNLTNLLYQFNLPRYSRRLWTLIDPLRADHGADSAADDVADNAADQGADL